MKVETVSLTFTEEEILHFQGEVRKYFPALIWSERGESRRTYQAQHGGLVFTFRRTMKGASLDITEEPGFYMRAVASEHPAGVFVSSHVEDFSDPDLDSVPQIAVMGSWTFLAPNVELVWRAYAARLHATSRSVQDRLDLLHVSQGEGGYSHSALFQDTVRGRAVFELDIEVD